MLINKMKDARYDKNFKDYEILKAKSIDGYMIVKDGNECDLIGREIKNLIFCDCTKGFDEILKEKPQNYQNFRFDNVKIYDENVRSIKIIIKGYDESADSLKFDLDKLALSAPYRYALSNDSFEINIFLDEKVERVMEFLSTFQYDYQREQAQERRIFMYINENTVYEKICK
ncbi:MAG: DUF5416 domain-containing protein [Campylobacter sp.]|nr:DUF5416 domain-containing protein [Campylobacter sp.]